MANPLQTYSRIRKDARQSEAAQKMEFTGRRPSMILYGIVGMIALLKDLLDLAIGPLLGIVTVVSICLTGLIWLLLLVFDRSGGSANRRAMRQLLRGLILIGVMIIEGIAVGLNYLPIETMTVILLYQMARRAWQKDRREATMAE